ncbi:MAG: N-acetyltransferase [Acidobacteria bacterium]|nr:MAG: N-acetyltransferase [Acidobacteriota bacterium]
MREGSPQALEGAGGGRGGRRSSGVVLTTERLTLREAAPVDAGFVVELLNDGAFVANIGDRGVRTHGDAVRYIAERMTASYRAHGFGMWIAERRSDVAPIGVCGIVRREGLEHPDLGYALLPAFRGQGYASEAAAAVLRFGREELALPVLLAIVSRQNTASVRVLEKIGFAQSGKSSMPGGEEVLVFTAPSPSAPTRSPGSAGGAGGEQTREEKGA